MKTNCSSAYLMKSIQVVSLILLISLAITGVVSGNVTFSISGAVHNDVNGNGEYDPGDRGIPDVYIRLLDSKNKIIADTDTDLNGNYSFLGLAEGNYYLEKTSRKGWEQTSPKSSKAIEVKLNGTDARGNPGRDFLDRRILIDKGIVDHIVDFLTDFKKQQAIFGRELFGFRSLSLCVFLHFLQSASCIPWSERKKRAQTMTIAHATTCFSLS